MVLGSNIAVITSIVLYLALMVVIGVVYSKKNNSVGDFYLGGRKLGPLVTAMSAEASDMSSYLLMGLPGLAYFCGLAEVGWTAIGLAAGTYLNFLLVAQRLRRYTAKLGAITLPDYFSKRFNDQRALRLLAALVIIIFFVPYTASGFAACGKLFSNLFGWDYMTTMIVSAVIIVLYTTMGGFLAASFTDLIQSIVMTVALLIVLGFGIRSAGGWSAVVENAKSIPGYLNLNQSVTINSAKVSSFGFIPVVSTLAWGLGYFGMPHILLRFMAIEDDKKLKVSRRIASTWVVISMGVAILIGIVGFAASNAGAITLFENGSDSEAVIVHLAQLLSQRGTGAALIAGLIIAGILASTMSTADSQLLAASSSVSEDIAHNVLGLKLSNKTTMLLARLTVVVISAIAIFLAQDPGSSIFGIVSFAWAGFGAAFGPVVLVSLFWKRANKQGALAGMFVGGAVVFLWKYLVRPIGGAWDIYELLPAFLCATIAIFVVSLLTAKPEKEIAEVFDEVHNMK